MMSLDGCWASPVRAVRGDLRRDVLPARRRRGGGLPAQAAARDLEISAEVIRDVCAAEIQEYLALDAKRDAGLPVHSIVEPTRAAPRSPGTA